MNTTKRKWALTLALVLACAAWFAEADPAEAAQGDVYPLGTCLVSGEKLGSMGAPEIFEHGGREIRLCCAGCKDAFEANADKYLKQLDEAVVKQQKPYYPLDTCIVMGTKLGSRGEPVDYVYRNRLVRFCCSGCMEAFEDEPEQYLAKLDEAVIAKQKASYPLDTCVVMGGKLGPESVDYVSGNRLVRFCCRGCIDAFRKDPLTYLGKLDEAAGSTKSGKSAP